MWLLSYTYLIGIVESNFKTSRVDEQISVVCTCVDMHRYVVGVVAVPRLDCCSADGQGIDK